VAVLPHGEFVDPVDVPTSLRPITLTGQSVTLRRPVRADAGPLYRSTHGDPQREAVWAYLGYGPWDEPERFEAWVDERRGFADPLWFTVTVNATGIPVGMVTIMSADLPNRRLELGHIWYVPEAQRTAANTEAVYLLLTEAFGHYQARRVEWKCDSLNERSRRAAIRLGFVFEGIFRNHMVVKGRNRDTAWYSITETEWPTVRENLETRLYSRNGPDAPDAPVGGSSD
jgi:RimJ/RimL family protein N-acetyltransferase